MTWLLIKYKDMDLEKALQKGKQNIQSAIDKGEEIASAYTDLLLGNNEKVAQERMDICKGCPLYKTVTKNVHVCNPMLKIEHATTKEMTKGCSCVLEAKTRKLESYCPAGKWNSVQLIKDKTDDI